MGPFNKNTPGVLTPKTNSVNLSIKKLIVEEKYVWKNDKAVYRNG